MKLTIHSLSLLAMGAGALSLALASGCSESSCEESRTCENGGAGGASGGSSSGAGSASGEGGEGGAGEVPSCDPSVEQCETELVVFVSPTGDDQAAGTKSAPLKTLGAAVALAGEGAGVIWACADEGAFEETLTLGEGAAIEIYGGLSCAAFEPVDAKTQIEAASASGHQLTQVKSALLSGVHLSAPAGAEPGESSVALTVNGGGAVELKKSALTAAKGADGAAGLGHSEAAEPGVDGSAGTAACVPGVVNPGGEAVTTSCGGTVSTSVGAYGGLGGGTASLPGGAGGDGAPASTTNNQGGGGESSDGNTACQIGGTGRSGTAGSHGAAASALGTLSSSGYAPSHGGLGKAGGLGEGGGGGGGAKKPTCATGASGGGGGSGGCGGDGAGGGQSGGASLGLVSLNAHIVLTEVTIKVAAGGAGGVGGDGQSGGTAGEGGSRGLANGGGSGDACSGGPGGRGGDGGSGGGGAGGPTFGIAVIGDAPSQTEVLFTLPSSGAPGAAGGALNEAAAGPAGAVKQQQEF